MPLFYTIRVHAIPLSDTAGGRACTVTAKAFADAIVTVNEIFEPAAVRFAFDPDKDWHPRRDTSLNNLHDGRAASVEEAILWHDGEAARARQGFLTMPRTKREALILFLSTL